MKKPIVRTIALLLALAIALLPVGTPTVSAAESLTVSQVTVPETGVVNPPVIVQKVTQALPDLSKELPAVAILEVDAQLNILSEADEVIGTAAQFLTDYRDSIVPAFLVSSTAEVTAVTDFVTDSGIVDAFVLAEAGALSVSPVKEGTNVYTANCFGASLVKAACETVNTLQGGLILSADLLDTDLNKDGVNDHMDWAVLRQMAANDHHITQLIFDGPVSVEQQTWYNAVGVAAWSWADSAADVYSGIAAGSHAIVAEDPDIIYSVYEGITATTVSGRPQPSAHRGVTMYHGSTTTTVKDGEGNTFTFYGEAENTAAAMVAAWNYFGLTSAELDPKVTAACDRSQNADGECHHDCEDHTTCELCQPALILEHDNDLSTTTNIEELRLDPQYADIFDRGNSRDVYTLYELKLLTVTGRGNNQPSGDKKMSTLEEVMEAVEDLADGQFVICCHVSTSNAAPMVDAMLMEHPEYMDNILIFSPLSIMRKQNWSTKEAAVPYAVAVSDELTSAVDQEPNAALADLIKLLNPYDSHFMGYDYERNTDGTDDFYYKVAARGILSYHSVVTGQENLNSIMLTGEGSPGSRVEQPWMLDDWHYLVDAPETMELTAGQALDVTHTVKTIGGDRFPEDNIANAACGFDQISGPALTYNEALGGYTAKESGEAVIAFYYEGTTEGNATYRVYAQPTTVTVQAQPAPENLVAVNAPALGQTGSITGLDPQRLYEYRAENADAYTAVEAGAEEITGLAVGVYYVRFQATEILDASREVQCAIGCDGLSEYRVYLDPAAGSNSDDGFAEATPVATMEQAVAQLKAILAAAPAGTAGTVELLSTLTITDCEYTFPAHEFPLVLTSNTGAEGITHSCSAASDQQVLTIGGDTTWENLTFTLTANSTDTYLAANGHKLTIGQGVTTVSADDNYCNVEGGSHAEGTSCESTDVTLQSGTWQAVYAGGYKGSVTGDAKLTIDGAAVAARTITSLTGGVGGNVTMDFANTTIPDAFCGSDTEGAAAIAGDVTMILGTGVNVTGTVYAASRNGGDIRGKAIIVLDGADLSDINAFSTAPYTADCATTGGAVLQLNTGSLSQIPAAFTGENAVVRLGADHTEAVTLSADINLDLGGCNASNITVAEGCTLTVQDSATDDFTVADGNYGTLSATGTVAAMTGYQVFAEENGNSYHKLDLSMAGVTLRPSVTGIYYQSWFGGDERIKETVQNYGVVLKVGSAPTADTIHNDPQCKAHSAIAGSNWTCQSQGNAANGTVLKNILAEANGDAANNFHTDMPVYGAAYIQLTDGSFLLGEPCSYSLQELVEISDGLNLTETQMDGLVQMYRSYRSIMTTWKLPNIKAAYQKTIFYPSNPYEGLSATFVGDSLTFGLYLPEGDWQYWRFLGQDLGFSEVIGYGVSSSCWSTYNNRGNSCEPLVNRYQNIADTDLIFIFMGSNDFAQETPLGTPADTTDISLCGAMNIVLNGLKETHPNSQVILMTAIQRYNVFTNDLGLQMQDYVDTIKLMADYHDIPVLDLYQDSLIHLPLGDLFIDKSHPTEEGHRILAGIIQNKLEENVDDILFN